MWISHGQSRALSGGIMDEIKILLVDDNVDNLDLLRSTIRQIRSYKINLAIATDGESALEIIARNCPDLILLDVMMPGLNGFEVCQIIREQYDIDTLPIIFVTAKNEDIDLGFEVGGNDYIIKPISTAEVIARTEHQIKLIQLTKKLRAANEQLELKVRERTSELAMANRQLREEVKERRYMQERLTYLATHDFLTQLYNRNALDDHITYVVSKYMITGDKAVFIQIDLDRFRIINETCGCFAGDELLRQFSSQARSFLYPEDFFARLGGDKFAVVCHGIGAQEGGYIAERIHEQMRSFQFVWEERVFTLNALIAIVEINDEIVSFDNLMLMADETLYHLKTQKINTLVYSDINTSLPGMRSNKSWALKLMDSLKHNQLKVYSQKILCLSTNGEAKKPKLEMLVRIWDESQNRLVYPEEFIRAAERFNLITEVDKWVINEALSTLSQTAGILNTISSICINLSVLSMREGEMIEYIDACLKRYGIPPEMLCFEMTETEALVNLDSATEFINKLHQMGCKFALDDFGSGFCSFNYLRDLPFDYVKIDGVFVRDMSKNDSHKILVRSIVDIAKQMQKTVVAEFVENEAVLEDVKNLDVDWVQGYLLHRPEPLPELMSQLSGAL